MRWHWPSSSPLSLIHILPHVGGLGVNGVFLAEPISNLIGGLACYITMRRTVMPELSAMERGSPPPEKED